MDTTVIIALAIFTAAFLFSCLFVMLFWFKDKKIAPYKLEKLQNTKVVENEVEVEETIVETIPKKVHVLNKLLIKYDDLRPSKNFGIISNFKTQNRFRDDWSKYDQLKYNRILKMLKKHKAEISEFVLTHIDRPTIHHLSRLQENEAVDFVLNQYKIFEYETSPKEVIPATYVNIKPTTQFDEKVVKQEFNETLKNSTERFKIATIEYFFRNKINEANERNQLNKLIFNTTNKKVAIEKVINSDIKTRNEESYYNGNKSRIKLNNVANENSIEVLKFKNNKEG